MQDYFQAPLDLFDGEEHKLSLPKALVSMRGIYQLYGDSSYAQQAFQEARIFTIRLGGQEYRGKLVREQGVDGVHYNFVFQGLESGGTEHLSKILRSSGIESPWKREFPRIPSSAVSPRAEYPVSTIFPRVIGQAAGEVVNFSCHGLLFEFMATGTSLGEFVGHRIHFDIITSQARRIRDIEAKIMRIYDEVMVAGQVVRGLGVKFQGLKGDSGAAYKDLLLSVCQDIRSSS
jgi:hypothetical protein